ncbi:MAG: tetratricopeptide repeat protein, partial [Promethearchaeota archaeon]
ATYIIKSLTMKDLDTIENRRIYVEACLQKIDRKKNINTAKKILILEDALTISIDTKYYAIVLDKLINNYMIFIKELISLGEVKQFAIFIDKIIKKFGNIVMVPIVETVIGFAEVVKNPDMAIDFLIRAYKLASSKQKKEIRQELISEVEKYHEILIKKLDFPGIINLQTRISSFLTNTNKIKILRDLSNLIKASTGKIHPENYITLLETYFEISRSIEKDGTTRQKRIISKLKKSFEGKLFESYVENAKTLIDSLLFNNSTYKKLEDIIHLAYINCGDNDTFNYLITDHFLNVMKKYEYDMNIESTSKIKFDKYALSFSNGKKSHVIKPILSKEEYFNDNFTAGLSLYLDNKFSDSLKQFKNATIIKPEFFENWYYIGMNYYNLEDYEKAKNSLLYSVKFSKYKDIDCLYYYAASLEKLEFFEESNDILDTILKFDYDHFQSRILKLTINKKTKNYTDMLRLYVDTVNIIISKENDADKREEKLSTLWNKYTQIVQSYLNNHSIFDNDEKDIFILSLNKLSKSFIKIDSFHRIFYIYGTLKKLHEKIEGKLFEYISKHLKEKVDMSYSNANYIKAIEYATEILQIDPDNVEAYSIIGNCYILLGQLKKAIKHIEKALELKPGNQQNLNNLASLYYTNKQYSKGIQILNKILELNPNYGVGYCNIAHAYIAMEEYKPALLNFLRYLHIHTSKVEIMDDIKDLLVNCIYNELLDEEVLIKLKRLLDFSNQYGDIHNIKGIVDVIENSELTNNMRERFENIFKNES